MRTMIFALCAGATAAVPAVAEEAAPYPLFDGVCDEYERLNANVHPVEHGITLHVFQDESYVWLCYELPAGSYGTLDLVLDAPQLADPINLHVSAQLGEWRAGHDDEAPQDGNSDQWWNNVGWHANAVRMNGYRETENGRRANFIADRGRELQLSKSRFGRGEWRLTFEIRAIADDSGARTLATTFPADGETLALTAD